MTLHLPTGSRLELADTCLGSAVLDDGIEEEGGPYAERGINIHAFLEAVNVTGSVEAAAATVEDPEARSVCEEINLDGLPLDAAAWAAEVTFAWNFRTGACRELGRGLKRDYRARHPDEIVLTVDAVSLVGEDAVFVIDWKTGYRRVTPARRHAQLRMGALAAAACYGRERGIVEIIRPRQGQRAYRDRGELDMFDLAEVASERRAMAMEIRRHQEERTRPRLRSGAHCERCGGRWSCPTRISELVAIARNPGETLEREVLAHLTPEKAGLAYRRFKDIDAAYKAVKAALKRYAIESGGIPLEDGFVYGEHEVMKPVLDGHKTYDLLEEDFGKPIAHEAVEVKTTKKWILDALRPVAPKRGLTKLHEAVLAKLTDVGGLDYQRAKKVEEYHPRDGVREIDGGREDE